jgi:hypothetical protein
MINGQKAHYKATTLRGNGTKHVNKYTNEEIYVE